MAAATGFSERLAGFSAHDVQKSASVRASTISMGYISIRGLYL
jgi:hypothetical protein